MLGTGNPAANKTVYDDPAIKKQLPDGRPDPRSPSTPRHRARRASTTATSPPACSASSARPTRVNPDSTPAAATDLITSVLKGNALL